MSEHELVIDRKKGSVHPRFDDMVYPLDYGYLAGTTSMDGGGMDVFRGSLPGNSIQGVICTVDRCKSDAEVKIVYNCTRGEIMQALDFLDTDKMGVVFVGNPDARSP